MSSDERNERSGQPLTSADLAHIEVDEDVAPQTDAEEREGPAAALEGVTPAALPVLPLKETVVFPESMTPLAVGQERSVQVVKIGFDAAARGERVREPNDGEDVGIHAGGGGGAGGHHAIPWYSGTAGMSLRPSL